MKIEVERAVPLTIVNIYLRSREERSADTISHVKGEMLLDSEDNLIGLRLFNKTINEEEFEMPEFKTIGERNIVQAEDGSEITIYFYTERDASRSEEEVFYINYDEDGLYGIEVILKSEDVNLDRIAHLMGDII